MNAAIAHPPKPALPFTHEDAQRALDVWGCNCGPSALAAAADVSLETVRGFMGDFEAKRYTSPTMMKAAIAAAGWTIARDSRQRVERAATLRAESLVRIQWTGPWTAPGMNPRWAYGYTHWIATRLVGLQLWIFDVNSGWVLPTTWETRVVPFLTEDLRRANGGWYATHTWTIARKEAA